MHRQVLLRWTQTILAVAFLLVGAARAEEPEPAMPGPEDRCPVCGMFVHNFHDWAATIIFSDGSRVFFDGPKDLFRYYLRLEDYRKNATAEEVIGIYVTEYYTTELISAGNALFVLGSDVMGPMGKELVPIGSAEAAETFRRDHAGKRVIAFEDVELSDISTLE